jgi:hypothetical protein
MAMPALDTIDRIILHTCLSPCVGQSPAVGRTTGLLTVDAVRDRDVDRSVRILGALAPQGARRVWILAVALMP